jgi:hypothetical protein
LEPADRGMRCEAPESPGECAGSQAQPVCWPSHSIHPAVPVLDPTAHVWSWVGAGHGAVLAGNVWHVVSLSRGNLSPQVAG